MPTRKTKQKNPAKPSARKRSVNRGGPRAPEAPAINEQDIKRRLGNFKGAGEAARQGGRQTGARGRDSNRAYIRKPKQATDKA